MSRPRRVRLDVELVDRGLIESRSKARALVLAGKVFINGRQAKTPGQPVRADEELTIAAEPNPFVSRGGLKLAGALDAFEIDPTGLVALDAGASTGGFTDCLLQRGARRVYAVDVGYGQLAWSLRKDSRVVVLERTNARHLSPAQIPELVELVTADLAFISLTKVLPALRSVATSSAAFVVLVKPQFEVGPEHVGKGGVVRDDALRREAVDGVVRAALSLGLVEKGRVDAAVSGPKGNREILLWLEEGASQGCGGVLGGGEREK